jgi:hypothetical protein
MFCAVKTSSFKGGCSVHRLLSCCNEENEAYTSVIRKFTRGRGMFVCPSAALHMICSPLVSVGEHCVHNFRIACAPCAAAALPPRTFWLTTAATVQYMMTSCLQNTKYRMHSVGTLDSACSMLQLRRGYALLKDSAKDI